MFCDKCGKELNDEAVVCTGCGCAVSNKKATTTENKNWVAAFLLAWFLGGFGIHRFYTGYIGIGIAQLLTLGGCGIWTLVDFIALTLNKFKDNEDKELEGYIKPLGMVGLGLLILGIVVYVLFLFMMIIAAVATSVQ